MRSLAHRADLGRYYRGAAVHAAPGVHEHAADLCRRWMVAGSDLLEVGAGSGALTLRLRDQGFAVTATDLEPAEPWVEPLDLDDMKAAKAAQTRYSGVVCVEVLEHLENPRAALRAIKNLLGPGGKLILSTPNLAHPHSRLRYLRTGTFLMFNSGMYYSTGHITAMPDWLLVEHLHDCGYKVLALETAGSMGFGRSRQLIHRLEMLVLQMLQIKGTVSRDDGVCLYVVAEVNATPP